MAYQHQSFGNTVTGKRVPVFAVVGICLLLYAIDGFAYAFVPESGALYAANFAIPFDLMVCVPAAFYLLFVRPRGISPIAVLPVIYIGGALSSIVAIPNAPSALPALFGCAFAVDVIVLVREVPRLARKLLAGYREAKAACPVPLVWFRRAFASVIANKAAANLCAMEITMWYYLLASWKKRELPHGFQTFTYHKNTGFLAFVGVIVAMGLVEVVVVHLLVAQWSVLAAVILDVLSVYALAYIVANARAVAINPILVNDDTLVASWGAFQTETVPMSAIKCISLTEPMLPKEEVLNMATMSGKPCWVALNSSLTTTDMLGRVTHIRAIKVTPDDIQAFCKVIEAQVGKSL